MRLSVTGQRGHRESSNRPMADLSALVGGLTSEPGAALGRLRQSGDIIFYPTVARVPGRADAFVVNWRRIGNSAQARTQLARILGSKPHSLATQTEPSGELSQPRSRRLRTGGSGVRVHASGRETVLRSAASSRHIMGLQSRVPRARGGSPGACVYVDDGSIAAGCLIVGGLAAWWLSRRVAVPIETLRARRAPLRRRTDQRVHLSRG